MDSSPAFRLKLYSSSFKSTCWKFISLEPISHANSDKSIEQLGNYALHSQNIMSCKSTICPSSLPDFPYPSEFPRASVVSMGRKATSRLALYRLVKILDRIKRVQKWFHLEILIAWSKTTKRNRFLTLRIRNDLGANRVAVMSGRDANWPSREGPCSGVQGDTSRWFIPPVDTKTKVPF